MDMKALFLDLDGTIIETKSGNIFSNDPDDWKFKKGILPKLKEYYNKDYQLIIVTNQGGISNGFVRPLDLRDKLQSIIKNIQSYILTNYGHDMIISDPCTIYYCVADSYNEYRKPSPKFALELVDELELDLSKSLMVGDMKTDALFSFNAKIGTYMHIDNFLNDSIDCSGIYKIYCKSNNKYYIGLSEKSVLNRLNTHIQKLNINKHPNQHLQNAWNKYGGNNFSISPILIDCNFTEKELNALEIAYIKFYNSFEEGFNHTTGGTYGYTRKAWNKGLKMTEELREKLSLSHKKQSKPVLCFTKAGDFIQRFPTIQKGAEFANISATNISRMIKGGAKSAGGYVWKFAKNAGIPYLDIEQFLNLKE